MDSEIEPGSSKGFGYPSSPRYISRQVDTAELWGIVLAWIEAQPSAGTGRVYSYALKRFFRFLGITWFDVSVSGRILEVTQLDVLRYTAHMQSRHTAPNTIRVQLLTLRSFYSELEDGGLIAKNPFRLKDVQKFSREPRRRTPMIPFEKVRELIDVPSLPTFDNIRDRAMMAVEYGGALRVGELCALNVGDVKRTQKGTLYVHLQETKAGKPADQALPSWVTERLSRYLEARKDIPGTSLWVNEEGARISPVTYRKRMKYWANLAGVPGVTPHSFRATAITKLLSLGETHRKVMDFSRHSSVQMVESYNRLLTQIDESAAHALSLDDEEKKSVE